MSKTQQQYKPLSAKRTSHQQRIQAKWDEIQAKSANENFYYVEIADYLVPFGFVTAVKRSVQDIQKFDPSIDVESAVEETFWNSLEEGMRELVGPTIEYIQRNEESVEGLQRDIAYRASQLGGKHD